MGEFKDTTGKTRVGVFLKTVAPEILNIAGSLTGIEALNTISNAIKGSTTLSDDQKKEAFELLRLDVEYEKEVTKRHSSDMNSDSWLSKNVRPITLFSFVFILTVVIVAAVFSDKYELPAQYVSPLFLLFTLVFSFYFGDRGIQKAIRNVKNPFKNKP